MCSEEGSGDFGDCLSFAAFGLSGALDETNGLEGLLSFFPLPFMVFSSGPSDSGVSVTGTDVFEACLVLVFFLGRVVSSGSVAFDFLDDCTSGSESKSLSVGRGGESSLSTWKSQFPDV